MYKKVGRKYVPIGWSDGFTGFPSDGFWLVQTKDGSHSSECIIKIDELENLKPAANLIYEYKDKICDYLNENDYYNSAYSRNDFVLQMLKEITK